MTIRSKHAIERTSLQKQTRARTNEVNGNSGYPSAMLDRTVTLGCGRLGSHCLWLLASCATREITVTVGLKVSRLKAFIGRLALPGTTIAVNDP